MIYPRKLLKSLRAAFLDKSISLDYQWKAQSRYNQTRVISEPVLIKIQNGHSVYEEIIEKIISNVEVFKSFDLKESDASSIYWRNNYFPGLDIVSLYTIVKYLKPSKIIEIGSGHSTLIMRRALMDGNLITKLICIDPAPRRDIQAVAHEWFPLKLEDITDFSIFETLNTGDILFFDGSHISLANTDVTVLFMEILPRIASGVYVHLHDIYLPYDYPQDMVERGYNEQYLLAQLIQNASHEYEVVFPAFYIAKQASIMNKLQSNLWMNIHHESQIEKHGGSFWLLKK